MQWANRHDYAPSVLLWCPPTTGIHDYARDLAPTLLLGRNRLVQLLEAIAGGGFTSPAAGKLALSKGQLEQLKTVRIAGYVCIVF